MWDTEPSSDFQTRIKNPTISLHHLALINIMSAELGDVRVSRFLLASPHAPIAGLDTATSLRLVAILPATANTVPKDASIGGDLSAPFY